MNKPATGDALTTEAYAAALPYAPSWLDRLMRAVEKLPVPFWLTYLLLGLGEYAVLQAALWIGEPEMRFVWQRETAFHCGPFPPSTPPVSHGMNARTSRLSSRTRASKIARSTPRPC